MIGHNSSSFSGTGQTDLPTHPMFKDLTGRRFGRLLAVSYAGRIGKRGVVAWNCICDCQKKCVVLAGSLNSGNTRSCGCYRNHLSAERHTTHGKSKTAEYGVWQSIIARCEYPSHHAYVRYGARGISVCERWRGSFENFIADMGERPGPGYEIDRKNSSLGYCLENCRWITRKENQRNKSSNHFIVFFGQRKTLVEWSEITGIPSATIRHRLRKGWSAEEAMKTSIVQGG